MMNIYSNLSGKKTALKLMILASISCAVLAFSSYTSHATGLQPLQLDPVTGDVTNLDVNNDTLNNRNHMIADDMQQLDDDMQQLNAVARHRHINRRMALRNFNYMAPEQVQAFNNNSDYRNYTNEMALRARAEEKILRSLNYMTPGQIQAFLNNDAAQ